MIVEHNVVVVVVVTIDADVGDEVVVVVAIAIGFAAELGLVDGVGAIAANRMLLTGPFCLYGQIVSLSHSVYCLLLLSPSCYSSSRTSE